jgi:hypothetical protein
MLKENILWNRVLGPTHKNVKEETFWGAVVTTAVLLLGIGIIVYLGSFL